MCPMEEWSVLWGPKDYSSDQSLLLNKKAKFEIQDYFKNITASKYFVFVVLFSSFLLP